MSTPISMPKGYKALGAFPIDASTLFSSLSALQTHAAGTTSYAGQICSAVENNVVTVYKINSDKSLTAIDTTVPAQVQSDWDATNNTQPDFIKNKPTIPSTPAEIGAEPTITTLPISRGGTGATTAPDALTTLGAASQAAVDAKAPLSDEILVTSSVNSGFNGRYALNGGTWKSDDTSYDVYRVNDFANYGAARWFFLGPVFGAFSGSYLNDSLADDPSLISGGWYDQVSSEAIEISITRVVVPTHTHAIADTTGLQAALDGKQPSGDYAPLDDDGLVPVEKLPALLFAPPAPLYQATYYKTENQLFGTNDGSSNEVTFDADASWNNSNGYITHAPGSKDFVVVQAGMYQLEWNASVAANSATWNVGNNKVISIDLTRNIGGSLLERAVIGQTAVGAGGQDYSQSVCSTFYLQAGDVINLSVFGLYATNTPAIKGVQNGIDLNTWFTWRYLASGATPTNGTDGNTVLSGSGNPPATLGAIGDFYINTSANFIFGPKVSVDSWPNGTSLVGSQGANGNTWFSGPTPPTSPSSFANNNDFYLDTNTGIVYKYNSAVWQPGANIRGPAGLPGLRKYGPIAVFQNYNVLFQASSYNSISFNGDTSSAFGSNLGGWGFFPVGNLANGFVVNPVDIFGPYAQYRIRVVIRQTGAFGDGLHCTIRRVIIGTGESTVAGLRDFSGSSNQGNAGAGVTEIHSRLSDTITTESTAGWEYYRCYFAAKSGSGATPQDCTITLEQV